MAWEETRGASRVVVAGARHVAHADDAKARADEASRLPTKSLRPRVLAGAGAGAVVLALVAFLVLRGGSDDPVDRAALADTDPTPTASAPAEPTAAEVLTGSMPSGVYRLVIVGVSSTTRGGATTPLKNRSDPVEWTVPAADCSDTQCSGTISSSSGSTFPFTWDGKRLVVVRADDVERDKKRACVDTVTGEVRSIATSAARVTWHYHYGQFTGTSDRMTSRSVTRTTYEFFGDCEPQPRDEVKSVYEWRLTPVKTG
jgi:hypothetical protein